jgi:hypothetical protein
LSALAFSICIIDTRGREEKQEEKNSSVSNVQYSFLPTNLPKIEGMSAVAYKYVHLSPEAEWLVVVRGYIHD